MTPKHMPDEVKKLKLTVVGCRTSAKGIIDQNSSFDYLLVNTKENERTLIKNGFMLNEFLSTAAKKEYILVTPEKQDINIVLVKDLHEINAALNAPIKRFVQSSAKM